MNVMKTNNQNHNHSLENIMIGFVGSQTSIPSRF